MLLHHRSRIRLAASLLTLSGVLAGCGGASGPSTDTPPDTPPTDTSVQISFTAPPSADNVYLVNAPIALQVRATASGALVADGTAMTLDAGPAASLAPVQPSTQGGSATSVLRGTQAGAVTVTARVAGSTASAQRTLYLRPAPQPLELLVPAYFDAGAGSSWEQLQSGAAQFPNLTISAILNPSDGVFSRQDAPLAAAVADFRNSGGKVLGYIYTGYGKGSRSVTSIKANVDNYLKFYGGQIDGFFLDEMAAADQQLDFYRQIYQYIKARGQNLRIIGNPGTYPSAGYAGVADVLVTFEDQAVRGAAIDPQPDSTWVYALPNTRQAALIHDATSCNAMQQALATATTARRNTALVYATDLHYNPRTDVGNPWADLPSYWDQLLATVHAMNQGAPLPRC